MEFWRNNRIVQEAHTKYKIKKKNPKPPKTSNHQQQKQPKTNNHQHTSIKNTENPNIKSWQKMYGLELDGLTLVWPHYE